MRFIHCSDLHLGTIRFGNDRLTGDFSRSFRLMAEDAVKRDVDAVIICGDLFNRFGANPFTLYEAEKVLTLLRSSGIEAIAVEGDHDVCSCGKQTSWLRFLAHRDLVKLLDSRHAVRGKMKEWSEETKSGSYIDIEGVRFCGLGYNGEMSSLGLNLFREAVEPAEFTVAMLHAAVGRHNDTDLGGMEGYDAEMLGEKVDYLALGHVHGRYSIGGWMFNPGGLENWRPEECLRKKGYFLVDVSGSEASVEAIDSVRRPGHVVNVDVSGLDTDAGVNRAIKVAMREADIDPATGPIVSVDLVGRPRFDLSNYDGGGMCSWVISLTGAVECLVNDRTCFAPSVAMQADRPKDLEVIREVVRHHASRLTPEEASDLVLKYRHDPVGEEVEEQYPGFSVDHEEERDE